ncbi:MAG: hypothetical protein HOK30_26610 [Rhodospirillaceae bacterium]|jgi:hypothetical protein|nr:hypothetical protein [Rhodospirillaceae bacterium]MBT5897051.1 hypothetical protein [Rhodospirillaceae bacterium]MBT6431265.1 hypothetical protein [Rhodospirillaceae bacterium]MBT7755691.1 hypothetical protein [Rhodospirillaceae bacterium]
MSLDDKALEQLARSLGLEKIHSAQPDLVRKAYDSARSMTARLRRPDDIAEEPSHIFRADNNV